MHTTDVILQLGKFCTLSSHPWAQFPAPPLQGPCDAVSLSARRWGGLLLIVPDVGWPSWSPTSCFPVQLHKT